jgi:hypothetical protein
LRVEKREERERIKAEKQAARERKRIEKENSKRAIQPSQKGKRKASKPLTKPQKKKPRVVVAVVDEVVDRGDPPPERTSRFGRNIKTPRKFKQYIFFTAVCIVT